jgi:hypothetical protein
MITRTVLLGARREISQLDVSTNSVGGWRLAKSS